MRPRSGAIHSDSEEGFMQLASASENRTGIFYDELTNRKVMGSIKSKKHQKIEKRLGQTLKIELPIEKSKNLFNGFDFSLEIQVDRQEREQLERMKKNPLKQINIGIISSCPQDTLQHLSSVLGVTTSTQSSYRGIDLIVVAGNQTIYKYWIFNRNSIENEHQNILMKVYLTHCTKVIQVEECYYTTIINNGVEECHTNFIKQNILMSLSC